MVYLVVPDACITTTRMVKLTKHTFCERGIECKVRSTNTCKARMNGANVRNPQIHVHRYTLTPTYFKF